MSDGPASAADIDPGALSLALAPASHTPDLAAQWRDLETRAEASFFLSWDWIGPWLALSGAAPLLLTARLGREIVGLALLQPARLRRHLLIRPRALLLHQTGDPERDGITIEYNAILTDRRCTDAVVRASIARLVRDARWDELWLAGVTDAFATAARRAGGPVWTRARKPSWRVDLDAIRRDGGPYLAGLGANTRYQIRRSMRLYEERGALSAMPARGPAEAMEFFDGLKALHQRYWQSRGAAGSFSPFFERFHRTLVAAGVERGSVELVRVSAGAHVIGYVYNFVYRGHVYNYQTGFSYDEDARLKPGLVSHTLCIERHLQGGAHLYDFLAGDHRYKQNLGAAGPEMVDIVLQGGSPLLAAERALRRIKAAIVGAAR